VGWEAKICDKNFKFYLSVILNFIPEFDDSDFCLFKRSLCRFPFYETTKNANPKELTAALTSNFAQRFAMRRSRFLLLFLT